MTAAGAYAKVTVQGKTLDARTAGAFGWAQARFQRKYPNARIEISQGSYNVGGVAASAGTHDGGGVLDCRTSNLTPPQRRWAVRCLKAAGFAAWFRDWPGNQHIHACLLGPGSGRSHKTMSPLARAQCDDYLRGRNGLKDHAMDRTWRPDPQVRWSHKLGKPIPLR